MAACWEIAARSAYNYVFLVQVSNCRFLEWEFFLIVPSCTFSLTTGVRGRKSNAK